MLAHGLHWVHGRLGTTLKLHGGVYYHPSCSIMANLAQSAFSLIPAIGWCQKSPWTSTRSRICRSLGMSSEPTMTRTAQVLCTLCTQTTYMYRGRPLLCILARYLGRCNFIRLLPGHLTHSVSLQSRSQLQYLKCYIEMDCSHPSF